MTPIEERMDRLMAFMILDDPFSHEILSILERIEVPSIPTMGVRIEGLRMELAYNPDFFMSLTDNEARYGFLHEVDHLVLHHCDCRKPTDDKLRKKHNIAADLAINSLLEDRVSKKAGSGYVDRIKGTLLPSQYSLKEKLSLEQYFDMLTDEQAENTAGGGEGEGEGEGEGGPGGPGGGEGDGEGEGEGGPGDGSGKPGGPGQGVPKNLGSHGGFDVHDGWSEEENALAGEIIRQKIRQMENSDRFWGNMPADIKERILEAQRSRIAWHKLLRLYYGQHAGRNLIHTFKRPNRRFGYPYTGYKRDTTQRALVLWDTSMSVASYELSQFLSETNRISETMEVDVQMFDADLAGELTPFDRRIKSFEVKGRGGTSFLKPFQLADDLRYTLVVCLTDGAAPAIPEPKFVKDVIWAIVGNRQPPVSWGKVVRIDTRNGVSIPEES